MSRFSDLTGQSFGRLTVLRRSEDRQRVTRWVCQCSCGKEVVVRRDHLRTGVSASCGCLRAELTSARAAATMIGKRFGRLVVLGRKGTSFDNATWTCQCDCGVSVIARSDHLTSGTTTSCGCAVLDATTTHAGSNTRLYRIWIGMRQRCSNPFNTSYDRYGGRGITVCERWENSFEAFREDMGNPPSELHSIERIRNSKGYSPENCRWATNVEQQNNTRRNRLLTYDGMTLSIAQWARRLGIPPSTISRRLRIHSIEKSLTVGRI